ncbi:hypothetical protein SDC9_68762 [bioreactor metagenome]|uniref:Uncharacterized protein n=1 Tax=bioreactor metagenome TaxID=1076179 RepID=A0A644Y1C0_9ZZZZ
MPVPFFGGGFFESCTRVSDCNEMLASFFSKFLNAFFPEEIGIGIHLGGTARFTGDNIQCLLNQ